MRPRAAAPAPPRAALAPPGDGHLYLGISLPGMRAFLEQRLQFPAKYDRREVLRELAREKKKHGRHKQKDEDDWITSACDKVGHEGISGYDLKVAIQVFCYRAGKPDKSVCEILLEEGDPEVGYYPQAFLSHIQLLNFVETLGIMRQGANLFPAIGAPNPKFWVDFLTLRQNVDDFDLPSILEVIANIGTTLVEMPVEPEQYLSRQFCIFEVFATLSAKKQLLCYPVEAEQAKRNAVEHAGRRLRALAVRSEDAKAYRADEQAEIASCIRENVGHERLNEVVKEALLGGIEAYATAFVF
mmetsp:Transcript_68693/g.190132  ORF Transcript_68693/g.190132 Transcript_68693/m.190132 type:complete len:299 (+) Transcript_68693:3-899(+)